jgi:zinc resistance-associated protein
MKKTLVISALVLGMGFFGMQQASADKGMGGMFGGMGGNCMKGGPGYSQLDPSSKEKFDKFYNETKDLRKQMVMKRAEKRALMQSTNPDSAKVATLAGELFDLQTTLQSKAEAAGVQGIMGCDGCQGPGQGKRGHRGGHGMMNSGSENDATATDSPTGTDAK